MRACTLSRPMTLSRLLTALSLVLVLALAACGGDDESSSDSGSGGEDAGAVYSEAVAGLDKLKSGKLQAQLDTVLELNDQEINVGEDATFSGEGGASLPEFEVDTASTCRRSSRTSRPARTARSGWASA